MTERITLQDVVTEARGLLQDSPAVEAQRRWSDADLTTYANGASDAIRQRRPDCRFDPDTGGLLTVSKASSTAMATPIWMAAKWRRAIVSYMCHRAYLRDAEDSINKGLADDYWAQFVEALS